MEKETDTDSSYKYWSERFISIESLDVFKAEEYVNKNFTRPSNYKLIPGSARLFKIRWEPESVDDSISDWSFEHLELEFAYLKEGSKKYATIWPETITICIFFRFPEDESNDHRYPFYDCEKGAIYNLRYIRYASGPGGKLLYSDNHEDIEKLTEITKFINFKLVRDYVKERKGVQGILSSLAAGYRDYIENQQFDDVNADFKNEWKNCPNCDESPCRCSDPF